MSLKIEIRIDRSNCPPFGVLFKLKTQMLRFDKDNNIICTVGHKELISLRNRIDKVVEKYKIDGKNTPKDFTING